MRTIAVSATIIMSLSRFCGESEEDVEAPPTTAAPASVTVEAEAELPYVEASAEIAQPQHGGTVVLVQDHAVEVVPHPTGQVHAYVIDVRGEAPPPPQTSLVVHLHASNGRPYPVTMSYDAEVGYYTGALVEVRPAPGPVTVDLTVHGRVRHGRVATYAVYAPTAPHVDVAVAGPAAPSARGEVRLYAPRPPSARVDVRVHAPRPPSAHVNINVGVPQPPSVRVNVNTPRPRGRVEVRRRHPGLMLGHHMGMRGRGMRR